MCKIILCTSVPTYGVLCTRTDILEYIYLMPHTLPRSRIKDHPSHFTKVEHWVVIQSGSGERVRGCTDIAVPHGVTPVPVQVTTLDRTPCLVFVHPCLYSLDTSISASVNERKKKKRKKKKRKKFYISYLLR